MADRLPSDDVVLATVNRWRAQSGLPPVEDLPPTYTVADLTAPQYFRSPRFWSTAGALGPGGAGILSVTGVRCVEGIVTIDRMYGTNVNVGDGVQVKIDRKSAALAYNQSSICFILNGDRPTGINVNVASCRRMLQNNATGPAGDIFWDQPDRIELDWPDRPVVLFPEDRLYIHPSANNNGISISIAGREYEV